MSEWHFSKVRLSQAQGVRAIVSLLQPSDDDQRAVAVHKLIWGLFADSPEDCRDFLWREVAGPEAYRTYYVLSPRPPVDRNNLFDIQTKAYDLSPPVGTRLAFDLRVNATVQRAVDGKPKRHDIVMDGLRDVPPGPERTRRRTEVAEKVGVEWLARKGEEGGFRLSPDTFVETYQTWRLPREGRRVPLSLGVLDIKGIMEVTDTSAFVPGVLRGFGRGKAFGLGLALLRKA